MKAASSLGKGKARTMSIDCVEEQHRDKSDSRAKGLHLDGMIGR
jgi:hypothetical protein